MAGAWRPMNMSVPVAAPKRMGASGQIRIGSNFRRGKWIIP